MKIGTDSIILGSWAEANNNSSILDIGTGTGVLSLMMAQKSNAKIEAVELDEKAYHQAKENFENSTFAHQITCHHTDIQIFEANKKYDIIICNPPYFDENVRSSDKQRDTARHTDSLSHDALFQNAKRLLDEHGCFYLILPYGKDKQIKKIALKHKLYCNKQLNISGNKDKEANRVAYKFSHQNTNNQEDKLYIYETQGEYSADFEMLTKDYYLPSIFLK